jgi:hypothetical protein
MKLLNRIIWKVKDTERRQDMAGKQSGYEDEAICSLTETSIETLSK